MLMSDFNNSNNLISSHGEQNLPRKDVVDFSLRCKISVIVPVYNVEKYLKQCLDSLAAQTLKNIEFIIVNDGSTDGSLSIIQDFKARDERFIILDRENAGYGSAVNAGFNIAQGEYIGIVESDDWVESDAFEKLYILASENDKPDVVKSNYFAFNETDEKFIENYKAETCDDFFEKQDIEKMGKCIMSAPSIWAGIYRRDFLVAEGISFRETQGAAYQDTAFILKVWFAAERVRLTYHAYLHYRLDSQNSSSHASDKIFSVCDEFRDAEEYLALRSSNTYANYISYLYVKKWEAYKWNMRRIDMESCESFLKRVSFEFAHARDAGLLKSSLFGHRRWLEVRRLIDNFQSFLNMEKAFRGVTVKNPEVSVILAVYNSRKTLRACLDSIVSQTLYEIEIICVDDGSNDSSISILNEYAAKDCRITIIQQENGGAGKARNTGLTHASGKYVSILDSDDIFEPDMLECALSKAKKTQSDIVVFRSDSFQTNSRDYRTIPYTIKDRLLPNFDVFSAQDVDYDFFNLFIGWAWDKLFRRDFIENMQLRFQEQRSTNDCFFVFAALASAQRITIIDKVFAHYRKGNGGISETREESWSCFYSALLGLRSFLKEKQLWKHFEQDFINYSLGFSLWQLKTLPQYAYEALSLKLRNEWFRELEITKHDISYFYNLKEYNAYLLLMQGKEDPAFYTRASITNVEKNNDQKNLLRKVYDVYSKKGVRGVISKAKRKVFKA